MTRVLKSYPCYLKTEIMPEEMRIPVEEVELYGIRAQGAGGQNVNKVSSAIHLRFDINASSLPEEYKQILKKLADRRISADGIIVIKAQRFRTQEKNRADALARLNALFMAAITPEKKRKPTKATRSSIKERIHTKTQRGQLKVLRGKVSTD